MSDIHCESLQLANHRENVPEWGGIFHLHDRRFHLMSCDGGNIVLSHPRVEFFYHFHLQCNDSHLLENYDFVANSTSDYCCIIAYCVLNFNALDISINVSHSSVPNGITINFMCKIGTE